MKKNEFFVKNSEQGCHFSETAICTGLTGHFKKLDHFHNFLAISLKFAHKFTGITLVILDIILVHATNFPKIYVYIYYFQNVFLTYISKFV